MNITDPNGRCELLAFPVPLRSILVATDLGRSSQRAAQYALEIARQYGCSIHFVHVVSSIGYTLCGPDVLRQATELAERNLDDFRTRLVCCGIVKGIETSYSVRQGDVAEQIERLACDEEIDLIVAGNRCREGLARWVTGSTSDRLRRRAQRPVLTVNLKSKCPNRNLGSIEHVLFAMDFGRTSDLALAYAASIAAKFNATLSIIHVLRSSRPSLSQLQRRQALIHAAVRNLRTAGPATRIEILELLEYGNVAERVVQVANSLCPNVIVLGQPQRKSLFTRGTGTRILSGANCPVLSVNI